MKKIIVVLVLLVSVSAVSANQYHSAVLKISIETRKTARYVPPPVLASYNAMYPGATTIRWTWKDHTFYQVKFIYNGETMTASYLSDGTYVGK